MRRWLVAAACAVAGAGVAVAATKPSLIMTPFESAVFIAFDVKRPEAGGYAVLSGDPEKGPSQILFRYGRGAGALHKHSSDYRAVVIKGEAKHWPEDRDASGAPVLRPGSYWSQPRDQLHGDSCLTDECLLFIDWAGKMD